MLVSDFSDVIENSLSNNVSEIVAYDKNGLKILFTLKPYLEAPNTTSITVQARNDSTLPITEFLFQAAVPKVNSNY